MTHPEDRRLADDVDLERWQAPRAPRGFVDDVMGVVDDELRARRRRARFAKAASVLAAAAAIAAILTFAARREIPSGSIRADKREDVAITPRITVDVAPGAEIAWRGDAVTQTSGDVFYRVERGGGPVTVATPAGDVEVLGTCFRVRVEKTMRRATYGAAAAAGIAAMVAVYEGKVAVAHHGSRVALEGGDAAIVDDDGVRKMESARAAEAALDEAGAPADPVMAANADLVSQVKEYKLRLERIAGEKAAVEKQLEAATSRLRAEDGGGAPSPHAEYDLTSDDWKELAKTGSIKFRTPCALKSGWTPTPAELNRLALAPDDGPALHDAYARTYERMWGEIRPMCASMLTPAVADRLGVNGCASAIIAIRQSEDRGSLVASMHEVAEMRAGLRPLPAPGAKIDPVTRVFLMRTGELSRLEADLARSIGPAEAHRIVFSDDVCAWDENWPGEKD